MAQVEQELLTVPEVAKMCSMSEKFIYKHIASKRMPGMVKCGRYWRFRASEVRKRFISGNLLLDK